jgi:hypothetical protein
MRWAGLKGPVRKSRFEKVSAKRWLDEVMAMQRAVREASIHGEGRRERLKPPLLGLFLKILQTLSAGSALSSRHLTTLVERVRAGKTTPYSVPPIF